MFQSVTTLPTAEGDLAGFSKLTCHFSSQQQELLQLFTKDTRPQPLKQLYKKAEEVKVESPATSFVCIPLTRSLHTSTRHYLDVETETKRVS